MAGELRPVYEGKFTDRFPELATAGKLFPTGDTASSCLTEVLPRPITPNTVRKFRNTTNPAPGVKTIFYGRADDPDIASHLTHGRESSSTQSVASLINPPPKTDFQQQIQDKKEAIYLSNRQAPLGRSHDQSPMLPEGLDIINTTFGIKVIPDIPAGELINPPKSFEKVDEEAREGHDLYVVSHNDYYAGKTVLIKEQVEQYLVYSEVSGKISIEVNIASAAPQESGEAIDRKYDSPALSQSFVYGIETPHFNDGRKVAKCLDWPCDLQFVREAMKVTPDRTFGMLVRRDAYGVGDLLHCWPPYEFLHGKDREIAVLTAVRQSLKNANYENFDILLEAFRHYDKNSDGMIDKDDLRKSCFQLNLNLDDELLDSLFDCCDLNKDGLINYTDFTNFLNWKDKMAVDEFEEKIITKGKKIDVAALPENTKVNDEQLLKQEVLVLKEPGSSEKTPKPLTRSTDNIITNYQTTSSQYNAVVGGLPATCYPLCGVPTIRSDIPAPRIRRVSDRTNYGDEANAYALMFPSVFSQKGVYERDIFKTRPKAEIAEILRNIGVNISQETFEDIWKQVCMKHQKEEVCVESLRNELNEIHESHTKPSL